MSRKVIAKDIGMEGITTERRWKVLRNALKRAAIVTLDRPISIDPEWVFGLETNLEGFSQADEHALPPNFKPFEVLFQEPGPTTFKFRDEVFFNSRSGERYFMNRLWHNHPPMEVEKTYSVVPGYSPPIYIYGRHGPHCF